MSNQIGFAFWCLALIAALIVEVVALFAVYSSYYVAFSELDFGSPTFDVVPLLKEINIEFLDYKNLQASAVEAFIFALATILLTNVSALMLVKLYYNPNMEKRSIGLLILVGFITASLLSSFYNAVAVQIGAGGDLEEMQLVGMESETILNPFSFVVLIMAISLISALSEYHFLAAAKEFSKNGKNLLDNSKKAVKAVHERVLNEAFDNNSRASGEPGGEAIYDGAELSDLMREPPSKKGPGRPKKDTK